MSGWETSVLAVTATVKDDEGDDSYIKKNEDPEHDAESVAEPDDDMDVQDYPEYEELDDEAPHRPHHDHPRRGDWDG